MKEILVRKRKTTLLFTTAVALLAVLSLGVSTYAWFQANADVQIATESESAEITVSAPDDMVTFYYFKGNGIPGSADYTGYSKTGATYGNRTNMVDTSTGKYTTDGGTSYTNSISSFANSWGEIDLESTSTTSGVASPKNCFNFSRIRVGCYYSFCIETKLSSTKVNMSFRWDSTYGTTGHNVSPKRYAHNGSANTSNPLNLLMAMNGYCYNQSTNNATTFIYESLGVGSTLSLSDKIAFSPVGTGTTTSNYDLLANGASGVDTTTNKYVFFTIFMGNNNDAFVYNNTTDSVEYYQYNQTSGSYSPMDGLKSSVSAVTVS